MLLHVFGWVHERATRRPRAEAIPLISAFEPAANSRALDLQGAFNAAHQICGRAGTIGRGSVGALADLLACYITDCGDVGSVCCQEVIGALTRTLDLAFDLREGEPILAAVAVSMRLVEARAPRSIVEETSSMRSQA